MSVVLYEKRGKVAHITLNRPEVHNALDQETMEQLGKSLASAEADADIWMSIVTGAGEKAFCAGADLVKVYGPENRQRDPSTRRAPALPRPEHLSKPVIAAVNGYCLAGGLELALGCDIRLAAERATFGWPGVRWSLMPGYGVLRMPHMVPMSAAMEMFFTGEPIGAQEAWRLGLVSRVVPNNELLPTATALAEKICDNGPLAVRAIKKLAYAGLHSPMEEGMALYQALLAQLMVSQDSLEGPRAFEERRKPRFQGS